MNWSKQTAFDSEECAQLITAAPWGQCKVSPGSQLRDGFRIKACTGLTQLGYCSHTIVCPPDLSQTDRVETHMGSSSSSHV